jgi:class 3 adenylate cyclase
MLWPVAVEFGKNVGPGMRISDADRQRVIDQLREHTGVGRLTLDEFEERVAEVQAAKTSLELQRTLRELPGGVMPTEAERAELQALYRGKVREKVGGWLCVNLICTGIWFAGPHTVPFWPFWPLLFTTVGLIGLLVRGADAHAEELDKLRRKRSKDEARREAKRTGVPAAAPLPAATGRILATVLYVDVVDSTSRAAELGDREWGALLDRFEDIVEEQIDKCDGQLIKTVGDGCLATFAAPAEAITCAGALRGAVANLGLDLRAGIHTGELQVRGDDVAGIAVHIGQRISALADPGEVLVSRTVVDLVVGSGISFTDRGEHDLKGVPGAWQVFAVA